MERFNDAAAWSRALTIPLIQGLGRHLTLHIPARLRKDQQITALIAGITGRYPDLTERVDAFNSTYAAPAMGGRHPEAAWYQRLVEHLSGRPLPTTLPAVQHIPTHPGLPLPGEAPLVPVVAIAPPVQREMPLPYTTDQFVRWLLQDPNRVAIDVNAQLVTLRDNKGYGAVEVHKALKNFTLTTEAITEIQGLTAVLDLSPAIRTSLDEVTADEWTAINSYLSIIMLTGKPPVTQPTVTSFPTIRLAYDTGKDPKQPGGFPRLVFSNKIVTWSTVPFGLHHRVTPRSLLITHIGGVPVDDYALFNNMPWNGERSRKLAYLLALSPGKFSFGMDGASPYDFPLRNIKGMLPTFPSVMRTLFGTGTQDELLQRLDDTVVPRRLTEGSRWRLFRHLAAHPDVAAKIPDPHTGSLPFAIEDYVPTEVWTQLPLTITRYAGPVITVPNPYTLLTAPTLSRIVRQREVHITRGQEAIELNSLDEIFPEWRAHILSTDTENLLALSQTDVAYFMAARGIQETVLPRSDTIQTVYLVLIALSDAGGIGRDAKEATPLHRPFVQDLFNSIPDREHTNAVCRAFNVDGYELLTTDQIKDLFIRGYVNPLPLSEDVKARHTLWRSLTQDKQRMLADMYSFPIGSGNAALAFVNRKSIEPEMEKYIAELSVETIPEIVRALGLCVPAIIDPMLYITAALPTVRGLFSGRKPGFERGPVAEVLRQMTDNEIMRRVGAAYAYRSRQDLITRGAQLLSGATGFFVPNERKCFNPLTYDFAETKDLSLFMIAYGTLGSYACYGMGELAGGFEPHGEETVDGKAVLFSFRIPKPLMSDTDIGGYTDLDPVKAAELKDLVTQLVPDLTGDNRTMAAQLLDTISAVERSNRGTNDYDKARYNDFLRFPATARETMRDYLMQVFLCGMYMRRWTGPPAKYPLLSSETNRTDFEAQSVLPHLEKIQMTMDSMKTTAPAAAAFVQGLREVEHRMGKVNQVTYDEYNIKALVDKVIMGYCIRMGSTRFVGSGAHYLHLFFGSPLPGYDKNIIENIA